MQPSLDIDGEGRPLEKQRYLLRKHRPLKKWWKNHIVHQHDVEMTNETYCDNYLKLYEIIIPKYGLYEWETKITIKGNEFIIIF